MIIYQKFQYNQLLKIISTNKGQNIDQIGTTFKGRAVNEGKIYADIQNIKENFERLLSDIGFNKRKLYI